MAIVFDAASDGSDSLAPTTTSCSWSHTATAGATVIVPVFYYAYSNGVAAATRSATYDGAAMTSRGVWEDAAFSNWVGVEVFTLSTAPSGAKTVQVNLSDAADSDLRITAGSMSYTGVDSVGSLIHNNGTDTAPTITVPGTADHLACGMAISTNPAATLSNFSTTQRLSNPGTNSGFAALGGEGSGTTLGATLSQSAAWYFCAVDLTPSVATTAFFAMF